MSIENHERLQYGGKAWAEYWKQWEAQRKPERILASPKEVEFGAENDPLRDLLTPSGVIEYRRVERRSARKKSIKVDVTVPNGVWRKK